MTEPSSNMEQRVTALESRVTDLTGQVQRTAHDAAAARVLAGGADRDVEQVRSEIRDFRRATTASFNALREDMTDLRTHVDTGFAQANDNFAGIRATLDASAAGQERITNLLTTMLRQNGVDPES